MSILIPFLVVPRLLLCDNEPLDDEMIPVILCGGGGNISVCVCVRVWGKLVCEGVGDISVCVCVCVCVCATPCNLSLYLSLE